LISHLQNDVGKLCVSSENALSLADQRYIQSADNLNHDQ
jgi:hypothetical protein